MNSRIAKPNTKPSSGRIKSEKTAQSQLTRRDKIGSKASVTKPNTAKNQQRSHTTFAPQKSVTRNNQNETQREDAQISNTNSQNSSPKKETQRPKPTFTMTPEEIASSSYRLSRTPQKFESNKAVEMMKNASWIEQYFQNHPEELDKSTVPGTKMQSISDAIHDQPDMGYQEKLKLLIQNKTLNYIIFGELSYKAMCSHFYLAHHYSSEQHYESALRHFKKIQELVNFQDVQEGLYQQEDPYVTIDRINLENAEAFYGYGQELANKKSGGGRAGIRSNMNKSLEFAQKVDDNNLQEFSEKFRLHILLARLFSYKKSYQESDEHYDQAIGAKSDELNGESSEELADLLVEQAESLERSLDGLSKIDIQMYHQDEKKKIVQTYRNAYDHYERLGLKGKMEEIEPKTHEDEDTFMNSTATIPESSIHHDEEERKVEPAGEAYTPVTVDDSNKFKSSTSDDDSKSENEHEKPALKLGGDSETHQSSKHSSTHSTPQSSARSPLEKDATNKSFEDTHSDHSQQSDHESEKEHDSDHHSDNKSDFSDHHSDESNHNFQSDHHDDEDKKSESSNHFSDGNNFESNHEDDHKSSSDDEDNKSEASEKSQKTGNSNTFDDDFESTSKKEDTAQEVFSAFTRKVDDALGNDENSNTFEDSFDEKSTEDKESSHSDKNSSGKNSSDDDDNFEDTFDEF